MFPSRRFPNSRSNSPMTIRRRRRRSATHELTQASGFSPSALLRLIMRVTVEIPDQFIQHLVPSGHDAARALLEEAAAGAYRDGRLTMEQVRQLLGFGTRMQVDASLQAREIYDYTVEYLDKDMATLDRLLATKTR